MLKDLAFIGLIGFALFKLINGTLELIALVLARIIEAPFRLLGWRPH